MSFFKRVRNWLNKHVGNKISQDIRCIVFGCEEVNDTDFTKFTIKKGKHRATKFPKGLKSTYYVRFDDTIKYDHGDVDQLDLNKLPGYAKNGLTRKNSERVGFRYDPKANRVELYEYNYFSGSREFKEQLADKLRIGYSYPHSDFKITYSHPDFDICNTNIYFGGNKTAPHDINIYLKNA